MSTHKKPDPAEAVTPEPAADEVVHVPKGKSKLRFLLTLGLMLFVLVIFTVGDQLMSTFSSGPSRTGAYMTWQHPSAGPQSISYIDFTAARRSIDDFFRVQGQRASSQQTEDQNIAYLLITDRLARDAGMEVSRAELGRMLREGQRGLCAPFFSEENYMAALRNAGVSPAEFEATLSWLLRVTRYEGLMLYALATPDPAAVERAWKDQHNEYAFEMVGLKREDLRSEAQLEEPDEAGLKAWYESLAADDKARLFREHFTPERISAELLSWTPGNALPAGLLERFPAPEGTDPAEAGRNHYDLFQHVRFLRPEPLPESAEIGLQERLYLPYEEVAERAADEARVRAALDALLADLRARKSAGEVLDLAALASELGLEFQGDGLPRSVEAWGEAVDSELVLYLRTPGEGNLLRQTVVGSTRLWLGQVLERLPSAPPTFEDVREPVRTAWLDRRSGELAGERLKKVYDALLSKAGSTPAEGAEAPSLVDASDEDFSAALADVGLAAQSIDWFDPARAQDSESDDPARSYLRDAYFPGAPLYSLADGQVAAPQSALDEQSVWLVRGRGKREPERVDMRPAEYQSLRQSALFDGLGKVYERFNSAESLAQKYGVSYPGLEPRAETGSGGS